MDELLTHRPDPCLERLSQGISDALATFASDYQSLAEGAGWLRDIAAILEPPTDHQVTGEQVAQYLRIYLDDLGRLPDLSPRLDAFRQHLDKVSMSYWPGLFHCYDLRNLPRTDNSLESHFRDTKRQLLRTTGQKGQTRHAFQRTGAGELLPRPPTEVQRLTALRQVPQADLQEERQRFQQHQVRFRLHTRSTRRANAQINKLPALAGLTVGINRVTSALLQKMTFSMNARASSLLTTVVLAIRLVIAACSHNENPPTKLTHPGQGILGRDRRATAYSCHKAQKACDDLQTDPPTQ